MKAAAFLFSRLAERFFADLQKILTSYIATCFYFGLDVSEASYKLR